MFTILVEFFGKFNSLRLNDTIWHYITWTALFQVVEAPIEHEVIPEPMLKYCQLAPQEQTSVKFVSEYDKFCKMTDTLSWPWYIKKFHLFFCFQLQALEADSACWRRPHIMAAEYMCESACTKCWNDTLVYKFWSKYDPICQCVEVVIHPQVIVMKCSLGAFWKFVYFYMLFCSSQCI